MANLVRINGEILQMPDFWHDFPDSNNSVFAEGHTFKGNWRRHRAIEKPMIFLRQLIMDWIGDAFPWYDLIDTPVAIILGFNCNFPAKEVALYIIWRFKGCCPIAVFNAKTGKRIK